MTYFCNVGSLILGLVAWILPLLAIGKPYRFVLCCIGSTVCCTGSLLLQLLEVQNRVHLEDWSALMDTVDAVILAAVVMLVVTLIANAVALLYRGRR